MKKSGPSEPNDPAPPKSKRSSRASRSLENTAEPSATKKAAKKSTKTDDSSKPSIPQESCDLLHYDDDGDDHEEHDIDEDMEDEGDDYPDMSAIFAARPGGARSGGMANQFREILTHLKQKDNQMMQMVALQELAEILSITTEEIFMAQGGPRAMGLEVDEYVKALLEILKGGSNADFDIPPELMEDAMGSLAASPELILLSCRCLANLIEALPTSSIYVIQNKGIEALMEKLMNIEYIDLAEQVLTVLEKISHDYPAVILKADGLRAALQYIDFFGLHVQRTAVALVANACKGLGSINRAIYGIKSKSCHL